MNTEALQPIELIEWAVRTYGDQVALASSFGAEDMVVIDLASRVQPQLRVFTLDTGRLHPETYQLMEEVERRYRLKLDVYYPDTEEVEKMVRTHGINLFYDSVEKRKLCCKVRKVIPLERALSGLSAWVTGLRREQSPSRLEASRVEVEPSGRVKVNPLVDWSHEEVWNYIRENGVPYNKLHDRGFPSIGCAPCTRAVKAGEDFRAGRWWWEETNKECGLHVR